jgi:lipoprotein-anchoring transpeptidase ErfK/SrfK
LLHAKKAIQNAREALRGGDRSSARRWAEQAAKLAPQLEDPWLILAAVASPRASVSFIERALQINPHSLRAREGMQWALKRLQEVPPAQEMPAKRKPPSSYGDDAGMMQVQRVGRSVKPKKTVRTSIFPVLLLALGCVAVSIAAWSASTSPALASILSGASQSKEELHPQLWAQVEIAKPTYTPESEIQVAGEVSTLPPPAATVPLPILEPTVEPTVVLPTFTPEPELEPGPTLTPEAISSPAGPLVMDIIEDTPVPTPRPTDENAAPTAKPGQPPVGNGVHWIEVNLSEQRVYAWEGDVLMNSFLVSTGTWQTPTVTGTFKIWNKTRIQAMSGPGYYLPNVPFVMYFYKDYGFHGTYWHNNFGTPMSHGCVNLTIPDSEWLYNWASYGTIVKVHY